MLVPSVYNIHLPMLLVMLRLEVLWAFTESVKCMRNCVKRYLQSSRKVLAAASCLRWCECGGFTEHAAYLMLAPPKTCMSNAPPPLTILVAWCMGLHIQWKGISYNTCIPYHLSHGIFLCNHFISGVTLTSPCMYWCTYNNWAVTQWQHVFADDQVATLCGLNQQCGLFQCMVKHCSHLPLSTRQACHECQTLHTLWPARQAERS